MRIHPSLTFFLAFIPLIIGNWKYCYEEFNWIPCGIYATGITAVLTTTIYYNFLQRRLIYRKKYDIPDGPPPIVELWMDESDEV